MTFASLHFLRTNRRVFSDNKYKIIDMDIVFVPIIWIFGITNLRVFLVGGKDERSGTYWFGVDISSITSSH